MDKGISVGEGSSIVIQELSVSNTNIGFAIKDSSFSEIFNVSGKNNNYCISSYRKKQEFGPSKIIIHKNNCLSFNLDYMQNGSVLEGINGKN